MGRLILIESLMLLVPMAVSLVYRESDWKGFAVAAAAAFAVGGAANCRHAVGETPIRRREGFYHGTYMDSVFVFRHDTVHAQREAAGIYRRDV